MTWRRAVQVMCGLGALASVVLWVQSWPNYEFQLQHLVLVPLLATLLCGGPFIIAFKLLDRKPLHRHDHIAMLVALLASVVVATAIHTRPLSPGGSDGLAIFGVAVYQGYILGGTALVLEATDWLAARFRSGSTA